MTAVILFAHGAKNPRWEKPMRQLADKLTELLPDCSVSVAFLQFGEPGLIDRIDAEIFSGANRVVVLPYFLAFGGHLLNDLPEMIGKVKKQHPDVIFEIADPIGEIPEVIETMAKVSVRFVEEMK